MTNAARARGRAEDFKHSVGEPPVSTPVFAPVFNLKPVGENDGPGRALARSRIVKLDGNVNQELADRVTAELLFHEAASPGTPITMLINSNGGSVADGWAIIDMMNMISSPVHTCAIGKASSMAATILLCGAKGHRSATPNARIMIHEASLSGAGGQADDMAISAQELEHTKSRMLKLYSMATGTSVKELSKKMGRDYYMYAAEAKEIGIIDSIAGDCKSVFNKVAQRSNDEHLALHKPRRSPTHG